MFVLNLTVTMVLNIHVLYQVKNESSSIKDHNSYKLSRACQKSSMHVLHDCMTKGSKDGF